MKNQLKKTNVQCNVVSYELLEGPETSRPEIKEVEKDKKESGEKDKKSQDKKMTKEQREAENQAHQKQEQQEKRKSGESKNIINSAISMEDREQVQIELGKLDIKQTTEFFLSLNIDQLTKVKEALIKQSDILKSTQIVKQEALATEKTTRIKSKGTRKHIDTLEVDLATITKTLGQLDQTISILKPILDNKSTNKSNDKTNDKTNDKNDTTNKKESKEHDLTTYVGQFNAIYDYIQENGKSVTAPKENPDQVDYSGMKELIFSKGDLTGNIKVYQHKGKTYFKGSTIRTIKESKIKEDIYRMQPVLVKRNIIYKDLIDISLDKDGNFETEVKNPADEEGDKVYYIGRELKDTLNYSYVKKTQLNSLGLLLSQANGSKLNRPNQNEPATAPSVA